MKIALGLFVSSATFTTVLAVAYWFVTREPAGTTLLSFMTAALLVIAGYIFFAEREADLLADKERATMAEARGEHVGTFVVHSPVPFWAGLSIFAVVLGLVVAPAAAGLGAVVVLFLGALMIVRSR